MFKKLMFVLMIGTIICLFSACGEESTATVTSNIQLTDNAINLTTNTLKQDTLVTDVAIVMAKDNKTINVAIQVNAATNKEKAQSLIDTAVRQLGSNCEGKVPEKNYLGEIWDNYDGNIRIFSGGKNIILDGYVTKGSNKITY